MKTPVIRFRELARALKKLGFEETRRKGSHVFFRHPDGRTTTAPDHDARDIAAPLVTEILREIKTTIAEFVKAIKD